MIRLVGNALIMVGLAGFAAVTAMPRLPPAVLARVSDVVSPMVATVLGEAPTRPARVAARVVGGRVPITHLSIPSIDLESEVVPAPLVERNGQTTWDVPRFYAGHAEGSAGAGEPGNVILIGHLTSLTLGNVFEHLEQVRLGDVVSLYTGEVRLNYRVSRVDDIARTDLSVLGSTSEPTVTLITCTGAWLPGVHDYAERLVVQAQFEAESSAT